MERSLCPALIGDVTGEKFDAQLIQVVRREREPELPLVQCHN